MAKRRIKCSRTIKKPRPLRGEGLILPRRTRVRRNLTFAQAPSLRRKLVSPTSQYRQRPRGASTITQQSAKNLFLWRGQSWLRKGVEVYFAGLLELLWPEQRILELYLNVAQFGGSVFGVEAAARTYFDKPAAALTREEAALLAAVLPSPSLLRVDAPLGLSAPTPALGAQPDASPGARLRAGLVSQNALPQPVKRTLTATRRRRRPAQTRLFTPRSATERCRLDHRLR